MIRKIKALGIAFMAVAAIGAVMATGAQAGFTASSYPASGSGGQTTEHVFTVQGQKVTCTEVTFTGSLAAASEEIDIAPKYVGCTAFGFINADVHMYGCTFRFTTNKPSPGSLHIKKCQKITITGGSCTVHIPEQTPTTSTVDYANSGGGVLVTSTVSGIHSEVIKGSFLCPLSNATTDTSGSYSGSTQFNGTGGVTVDVG